MATWEDVRRLVSALPGTEERPSYGGRPSWRAGGGMVVWDRPLGARDREQLGDDAPPGDEPLLGVRVADEGVKAALLAEEADAVLTVPHLDGTPVVLVRLRRVRPDLLAELVEDAWRCRAPRRLVAARDADGRRGVRPPGSPPGGPR